MKLSWTCLTIHIQPTPTYGHVHMYVYGQLVFCLRPRVNLICVLFLSDETIDKRIFFLFEKPRYFFFCVRDHARIILPLTD